MVGFKEECWDAVVVSGYLTRGIITGAAAGCYDSMDAVLELWQRGENFVVSALRQTNNLSLTQNYGEAGLNAAMSRFNAKYHTRNGICIWQDPTSDSEAKARSLIEAKVDSLGHVARAYKQAERQYGTNVTTLLDNAFICFAKALTMGENSPEKVFETLKANYPDVSDEFNLARIQRAHSSAAPQLKTSSMAGCYVATAVYGSYDCPQVWVLRRYRDYHLAESWCGRLFIRAYYAVSPTLVRLFGDTRWFKAVCGRRLDSFVDRLSNQGYSSEPYEDRQW